MNAQAPGSFEYNPENNTLTKGNSVHLAPTFINQATGNASAWRVADIWSGSQSSNAGRYMKTVVGDTLYFSSNDGTNGGELWAHDTSNGTTWLVTDINAGAGGSDPGQKMSILVGDTLYFDAYGGMTLGRELWAHDTSNGTTWLVSDINSGSLGSQPGKEMSMLIGDTLYFDADDG